MDPSPAFAVLLVMLDVASIATLVVATSLLIFGVFQVAHRNTGAGLRIMAGGTVGIGIVLVPIPVMRANATDTLGNVSYEWWPDLITYPAFWPIGFVVGVLVTVIALRQLHERDLANH